MYVHYLSGAQELFDLRRDPYELHNVAHSPAYSATLAALRPLLHRSRRNDRGIFSGFQQQVNIYELVWPQHVVFIGDTDRNQSIVGGIRRNGEFSLPCAFLAGGISSRAERPTAISIRDTRSWGCGAFD